MCAIAFVSFGCATAGMVVWNTLLNTLVPPEMLRARVELRLVRLDRPGAALVRDHRPAAELFGARTTLARGGILGATTFVFLFLPGVRDPEREAAGRLADLVHVADVGDIVRVLARARPRTSRRGSPPAAPGWWCAATGASTLASFHLRAPRAVSRVGAEGGADARHLVGGDRGAGSGPAAHDGLLGAALGHVARGGLRGPGPVVALASRRARRARAARGRAGAAPRPRRPRRRCARRRPRRSSSQAAYSWPDARAARSRDRRAPPVARRHGRRDRVRAGARAWSR